MKSQKFINMLLGGLMVLGSLASCSSDSGNDDPQQPAEKRPANLKVEYTANVSQQLFDVAIVTIRYIGENGQIASEQMFSTTWKKSVTITLPNKAGFSIQPTLKGAVPDGEYALSAGGQMAYTWLDADGNQLQVGGIESCPIVQISADASGVGRILATILSSCQIGRAFSTDYGVTDAAITWGGNAEGGSTQGTGISNEGATGDSE
jgi:hypothetical protein